MVLKHYYEQVNNTASKEDLVLPQPVLNAMWELFCQIGIFWQNLSDPTPLQSDFLVFLQNRIELNPNYRNEYSNAMLVIDALKKEEGPDKAYEILFTDPKGMEQPPTTRLARARQFVSNEFVALQLALGGFKDFSTATNYPGYFGGANIPGRPPYRTSGGKS